MSLWKNHALFFIIWKHFTVVFSLMLYLGLLGACLQFFLTLTSRHKPLWSFGFWLVIPLYASVYDVLSLCTIMAVIAPLVGRSQSFTSLHFVLSMSSTRASNSQKPSFSNVSTIIPISNFLFQVHSICFYLSFKLNSFWCYLKISQ
jgi:hypothetical protein